MQLLPCKAVNYFFKCYLIFFICPIAEREPTEVGEASSPAPPSTPAPTTPGPRQSGSLVTHHDDVITRMKNIQMIELGKHRIKPWYFSPYPQVRRSTSKKTNSL